MAENLLTPSKITAWLDCAHYLSLRRQLDDGDMALPTNRFGEMAELLRQKGFDHEQEVLRRYRASGKEVVEVPQRSSHETFEQWTSRVSHIMDEEHEVVFQMPFVCDGVRGIADFLEGNLGRGGVFSYEPVDAKLSRHEAKPGHVLQLCFYAEAVAEQTGVAPDWLHLELGSGERERIRTSEVSAYWRRLRSSLAKLLESAPLEETQPEPCDHCDFCEFQSVCDDQWRKDDSLVHIAGMRRADRRNLESSEVTTISRLGKLEGSLPDFEQQRLDRLRRQASLQVKAREAPASESPPFEVLRTEPSAAPTTGPSTTAELVGFAALPKPDDGDVFLDFEGHPFWRADGGLLFLFGLLQFDSGSWNFKTFWAHDKSEEATATAQLVDYLEQRQRDFPAMHVYHYNHTERTVLHRLSDEYGIVQGKLEHLVETGAFVDLLPVVTGSMQVGVESYGLKSIERLTEYQRAETISMGTGAVIEYDRWMADRDDTRLSRIAAYNEDDVRATRALRDWLIANRPEEAEWRQSILEPQDLTPDLDARIAALHSYGPDSPEHLLGDLLGYWARERKVVAADCLRLSAANEAEQTESPSAIAGVKFESFVDRLTPTGKKAKWQAAAFSYADQALSSDVGPGSKMIVALNEQEWAFFTLTSIDRESRTIEVSWNQKMIDQDVLPTSLVHYVNFAEGAKLTALVDLADQLLLGEDESIGLSLLRNEKPKLTNTRDAVGRAFASDYESICELAANLDRSFVPVQGPPGTGKTFTGSHIIKSLVQAGKRVGVTAMSHNAIDNLMQAVVDRFDDEQLPLSAVRKAKSGPVQGVRYLDSNDGCASGPFDVVAGTPWLFASPSMRSNPVDVLVIDEAGQLSLVDALASSLATQSVVLLGDPQQLPQVSQAAHPNGSGASALEHVIGKDDQVVKADRGVLLETTWRMHPDVCRFISDTMYEGKLASHSSCSNQSTSAGTGLRWLRVQHQGRSTEAPEEAVLVAEKAASLIGLDWTDQMGRTRPLTTKDLIVVTPYNDQRRLITEQLNLNPATSGIEVGTADKFQGREAAVVFYSMTTSSEDCIVRGAGFLFSKNRLNVAISRARCLVYLICTEQLLNTRAGTVEEMKLVSALCSFVEMAETT